MFDVVSANDPINPFDADPGLLDLQDQAPEPADAVACAACQATHGLHRILVYGPSRSSQT